MLPCGQTLCNGRTGVLLAPGTHRPRFTLTLPSVHIFMDVFPPFESQLFSPVLKARGTFTARVTREDEVAPVHIFTALPLMREKRHAHAHTHNASLIMPRPRPIRTSSGRGRALPLAGPAAFLLCPRPPRGPRRSVSSRRAVIAAHQSLGVPRMAGRRWRW